MLGTASCLNGHLPPISKIILIATIKVYEIGFCSSENIWTYLLIIK